MYVDTSVAVKLYAREPDSDACELLVAGNSLVSSELLYGELWSAFLAKERANVLSKAAREALWRNFEADLDDGKITLLPLNGIVVRDATDLMRAVHPDVPLRTLDALHLATFASIEGGPLFTNDKRMIAAAQRLALSLVRAG